MNKCPIDEAVKKLTKEIYCRLCPGANLATSTLWLTAATLLSTFNLTKSVDKDGNVIEPSREYHVGLVR